MDVDLSEIKQFVEGTIDFEGQKVATRAINKSLYVGAAFSVAATLITDRFEALWGGLLVSYALSLALSLPWGAYRKNPVTWASS